MTSKTFSITNFEKRIDLETFNPMFKATIEMKLDMETIIHHKVVHGNESLATMIGMELLNTLEESWS